MNVMALLIYGSIIFPKVLGHVEGRVVILVNLLQQNINPVPVILAETIRSLNFCRIKGDGRFLGCAQLLYVWLQSHLPLKESKIRRPFFPGLSCPIKEIIEAKKYGPYNAKQWEEELSTTKLHMLAPWMIRDSMIYKCGNFPWVPLLGLWGMTSYAPALARRQFQAKQFIPPVHGLCTIDCTYEGDETQPQVELVKEAWMKIHLILHRLSNGEIAPEFLKWVESRKERREGKGKRGKEQVDSSWFSDSQSEIQKRPRMFHETGGESQDERIQLSEAVFQLTRQMNEIRNENLTLQRRYHHERAKAARMEAQNLELKQQNDHLVQDLNMANHDLQRWHDLYQSNVALHDQQQAFYQTQIQTLTEEIERIHLGHNQALNQLQETIIALQAANQRTDGIEREGQRIAEVAQVMRERIEAIRPQVPPVPPVGHQILDFLNDADDQYEHFISFF